jgi:hypothetical protein
VEYLTDWQSHKISKEDSVEDTPRAWSVFCIAKMAVTTGQRKDQERHAPGPLFAMVMNYGFGMFFSAQ